MVVAVLAFAVQVYRTESDDRLRRWALTGAALVVLQVALGFASVLTVLAVLPVSLHTLVAAGLLAVLVHLATISQRAPRRAAAAATVPAA